MAYGIVRMSVFGMTLETQTISECAPAKGTLEKGLIASWLNSLTGVSLAIISGTDHFRTNGSRIRVHVRASSNP